MNNHYSITAYEIELKLREKGINGFKLQELNDNSLYVKNKKQFLKDFIQLLKKTDYLEKDNYLNIVNEMKIQEYYYFFELEYGRINGNVFSVHSGKNVQNYDKNSKIIRKYYNYFFASNDRLFLIAFRYQTNSCKSAIEKEMHQMLQGSNVMVELVPKSNREYVNKMLEGADITNIQYDTIYRENHGDNSRGSQIKKYKYSTINIDVYNNKFWSKFHKFEDLLRGSVKTELVDELRTDIKIEKFDVDDESIKIELSFNGTKRIISLADLDKMLYSVDITAVLQLQRNGEPNLNSLNTIVKEYLEGILKYVK